MGIGNDILGTCIICSKLVLKDNENEKPVYKKEFGIMHFSCYISIQLVE